MIKKIILIIILSIIIASGVSVYATYNYLAKDIKYIKTDGTQISVEDALNELYNSNNKLSNFKYEIGTNNSSSGTETIIIEHDNDNAILTTGQEDLEYSINSTSNFTSVTASGANNNGMGFYYSILSVKKGDTIYIKRGTNSLFGYALVY